MRDSDRILDIIRTKSHRAKTDSEPIKEHLLITRYSPKRVADDEMLSYQDVQAVLRISLIGIIPESESMLHASNQGKPAIHFKDTNVAQAYEDVVSRFLGEELTLRFASVEDPSFLQRIFGVKQ